MVDTAVRVLVASANPVRRSALCDGLRQEGFQVLAVDTSVDALAALRRPGVDVAIVAIDLPDYDGLELVRRARLELTVPLVLLGSSRDHKTRITGLEAGADDVLVEPSSMGELVATIRALLRRTQSFVDPPTMLRHGGLELDLAARRCEVDGRAVELTRREFDLLHALVRYEGRIHSRGELIELVWGASGVTSNTVDVHVAALRRKLGRSVSIETLRGFGYALAAPV